MFDGQSIGAVASEGEAVGETLTDEVPRAPVQNPVSLAEDFAIGRCEIGHDEPVADVDAELVAAASSRGVAGEARDEAGGLGAKQEAVRDPFLRQTAPGHAGVEEPVAEPDGVDARRDWRDIGVRPVSK